MQQADAGHTAGTIPPPGNGNLPQAPAQTPAKKTRPPPVRTQESIDKTKEQRSNGKLEHAFFEYLKGAGIHSVADVEEYFLSSLQNARKMQEYNKMGEHPAGKIIPLSLKLPG
jgi:hypothetical protein